MMSESNTNEDLDDYGEERLGRKETTGATTNGVHSVTDSCSGTSGANELNQLSITHVTLTLDVLGDLSANRYGRSNAVRKNPVWKYNLVRRNPIPSYMNNYRPNK